MYKKELFQALIREPSYTFSQIKPHFSFNFQKKLINYGLIKSFILRHIWIMLTFRCNLRCKMCPLWGESGVWKNLKEDKMQEELDFEDLKKFIDDVAKFKPFILLTGGEPLLSNNWKTLAHYIKSKNLRCSMSTNATKLNDNIFDVLNSIDNLDISLDGNKEIHNKIRGVSGVYQKVVEGIKEVDKLKKQKKLKKPYLKISFTINDLNYEYLEDFLKIIDGLNVDVDNLIFRHLEFTTEENLIQHKKFFIDRFNIKDFKSFSGISSSHNISLELLIKQIKEIKNVKYKNIRMIKFMPELEIDEVRDFYENKIPKRFKRCYAPWFGISILPSGDVWLCPDYVIGNIKKDKISEIFNNEKSQLLRKTLQELNLFPACHSCSSLFVH